jgi:hypothetical protein
MFPIPIANDYSACFKTRQQDYWKNRKFVLYLNQVKIRSLK